MELIQEVQVKLIKGDMTNMLLAHLTNLFALNESLNAITCAETV